jgi:ABC-type nickel/cobalt efflux system permease component RcnA
MRVKQVLNHVNESWLPLIFGAAVGNLAKKSGAGNTLALMVSAATYGALTKLAPAHRKQVVVTATTQSEALANQRVVQNLIDKMSYKLDDVEYIGAHGRKWTLSAK